MYKKLVHIRYILITVSHVMCLCVLGVDMFNLCRNLIVPALYKVVFMSRAIVYVLLSV